MFGLSFTGRGAGGVELTFPLDACRLGVVVPPSLLHHEAVVQGRRPFAPPLVLVTIVHQVQVSQPVPGKNPDAGQKSGHLGTLRRGVKESQFGTNKFRFPALFRGGAGLQPGN